MKFPFGSVVLANFNDGKGKEVKKIRPCIVFSSDMLNEYSSYRLLFPLTSDLANCNPIKFSIHPNSRNNIKVVSACMCDQFRSVDTARIISELGMISQDVIAQMYRALDILTGRSR